MEVRGGRKLWGLVTTSVSRRSLIPSFLFCKWVSSLSLSVASPCPFPSCNRTNLHLIFFFLFLFIWKIEGARLGSASCIHPGCSESSQGGGVGEKDH